MDLKDQILTFVDLRECHRAYREVLRLCGMEDAERQVTRHLWVACLQEARLKAALRVWVTQQTEG